MARFVGRAVILDSIFKKKNVDRQLLEVLESTEGVIKSLVNRVENEEGEEEEEEAHQHVERVASVDSFSPRSKSEARSLLVLG